MDQSKLTIETNERPSGMEAILYHDGTRILRRISDTEEEAIELIKEAYGMNGEMKYPSL